MENTSKNKFRVLLAGLDLSDMDTQVIAYSAMLCKNLDVERIYFVHVAKSLELPERIYEEYPDTFAPVDESLEKELSKKIALAFSEVPDVECIVEVLEGNAIDKLLRFIKIKQVDMILMGRKLNLKGSGLISSRLAMKSPCSLLLIPENHTPGLNRIVVPVDFSSHSALAVEYASEIAVPTGAELSCINLYKVPSGYHATGKSFEEFAEIMRINAQKEFDHFLKKHAFQEDVRHCAFVLDESQEHADLILEEAEASQADLIILGSRGRTATSAILIGSLAEKLTYKNNNIPLLIAKEKGENMTFLEALLRI